MNFYILLVVLFALIAVLVFIYFACVNNLKGYKEKMDKAEKIIDENLQAKLEIIITLNNSIKKVTGKKDYLKDFISIKDMIITNNEKDMKLEEASNLINDLANDYDKLAKDTDFSKNFKRLREIDEVLIAAKNVFNQNAIESNKLLKNIPYNMVSKIANFKIRGFYNTNKKTDDKDLF